jgi:amidophosphoribosyltransferase
MSGFFGIVSTKDCVSDLFFGTDYHSHLGTRRGGLAIRSPDGIKRVIHDITNSQFRSKFEDDLRRMHGPWGLGVISDYEDQPLIIGSHLGTYAIVTVGVIKNLEALVNQAFKKNSTHFSEMSGNEINPTEVVANLINQEATFEDGLRRVQLSVEGSCSVLVLTNQGLYAARDRWGRTPVILGRKEGSYAVTLETTAFPNLDFEVIRDLGPGEIVLINDEGVQPKMEPMEGMRMCAFLWVYYGYPSSTYEGINVELARNRCGAALARRDTCKVDLVAGIPDSGTAHAVGYANEARIPLKRPFVKYTPTWPRSFMPQDQSIRDLVARMKLIPIRDFIEGQRLLFCEDSIVRGTQLKDIIQRLYAMDAREIHMRPACPPLVFGCKYLNFSRSRSELDLAGRKAIQDLEGHHENNLEDYANPCSDRYCAMVEKIRKRLNLTTLQYQRLDDLVEAIGLPREKLCTYCWSGKE